MWDELDGTCQQAGFAFFCFVFCATVDSVSNHTLGLDGILSKKNAMLDGFLLDKKS